jgi:BirA family biotin operon repressor/biotin-[acetyl-CoA-carboxylase] ligase
LQLPFAGNPIGTPFIELQSVDSTNKYAMSLLKEEMLTERQVMAIHGTVVFAHEQTAGKGQRGKSWQSENKNNVALSIIINPFPLFVSEQFKLSVCTAVSVVNFFLKYAGDETKIKWPNDLYWRDRKAGGVLIENIVGREEHGSENSESGIAKWKCSIIGIGININQTSFSENLPNPVSLKQITGKNFEPVELAKLCEIFNANFQLIVDGKYNLLFQQYQSLLYKRNEKVKLKKSNRIFETTINGVAESGQLITRNNIEERFDFGEIEWIS